MALIKCPECGNEISDKARICTKCGYPIHKIKREKKPKIDGETIFFRIIIAIGIILFASIIVGVTYREAKDDGHLHSPSVHYDRYVLDHVEI